MVRSGRLFQYLGLYFIPLANPSSLDEGTYASLLCCKDKVTPILPPELCGANFCALGHDKELWSIFEIRPELPAILALQSSSPTLPNRLTWPPHFHVRSHWIVECDGLAERRVAWLPEEWRAYRILDSANGRVLLQKKVRGTHSIPASVLLNIRGCLGSIIPSDLD